MKKVCDIVLIILARGFRALKIKISQFPDGFRLKNFSRGPFLTNYHLECWLISSISYWPLINIASFFKSIRYFELFNHRLFIISTLALQNKQGRGIQRPYPPKFIFFHTAILTTFDILWSVQQKTCVAQLIYSISRASFKTAGRKIVK